MKPENFIKKYIVPAMLTQYFYSVPASITMAQAILESGWGKSSLTKNANNFFGIKADSRWNGDVYNAATHEYYNNQRVNVVDGFRAYKKPIQSFKDHAKFLKENKRYDNLFQLKETDYKNWAIGLKQSGYATSPTYDTKLTNIIEKYNLAKYDSQVIAIRTIQVFTLLGFLGWITYYIINKTTPIVKN